MPARKAPTDIERVAENRKARHDYHVEETLEAGIALTGSEVKSLRRGQVNLRDAYCRILGGEVYLIGCHIAPYREAGPFNHDPYRDRKLLLHREEIDRLAGRVRERGYTLIPLAVYFRRGRAKVALGLCRGKKQYDKRRDIAERDARREIARALKRKA